MTTKVKKSAPSKKESAPTKILKETAAPAKSEKKSSGKAAPAPEKELEAAAPAGEEGVPAVDAEELEEAAEAAAASAGGGNAAAIAAAGSGEMSASFKNFRHHPDMENFYRFIYENDLRHEALAIIDEIIVEKANRRAGKTHSPSH